MPAHKKEDIERFLQNVYPDENGCMIWTASITGKAGYGKIKINKKRVAAHRWSYELRYGPIPEGLHIDHLCRVRRCINPDHLEAVPPKVNINRGRRANSEKTHCPKGHAYTYVWRGWRQCKICKRIARLKYNARISKRRT